jgi:hypothetical protein
MKTALGLVFAALPLVAAAQPEAVPIDIRLNLPLVRASVNGSEPLTFIIDSAASQVCLDARVAADLGLKPLRRSSNSGTGGTVSADVHAGVPIRVGDREFTPGQIRGIDFSSFASAIPVPVHGILGKPFFLKYVVEIDYPNATLRLFEPGAYEGSGNALPMRIGAAPTVAGAIQMPGGDPIAARLEIDTGSSGLLILAAPFIRKHRLLEGVRAMNLEQGSGVGGQAEFLSENIARLDVGGFTVENPATRFAQGEDGLFARDYRDGNLGGEFLRRFRVVLDFPDSRLFLEREGARR